MKKIKYRQYYYDGNFSNLELEVPDECRIYEIGFMNISHKIEEGETKAYVFLCPSEIEDSKLLCNVYLSYLDDVFIENSEITIPAKNAPSAKETSNSSTAPKAIPNASASTDRVNSSREPVAALRAIIHGTRRRPTSIIMAINAITLPMVIPISTARVAKPTSPCSIIPATAGSNTSVRTITRSSTINQPMAICPR